MSIERRPVWLRWVSRLVRGASALLVLVVGFGVYTGLVAMRVEPVPREADEAPIRVQAIRLEPVESPRIWTGYGTARAWRSADVAAQVSARVVRREPGIDAGVSVRADQVLFVLEDGDFTQRVASLRARESSLSAVLDGLAVRQHRLSEQVEAAQDEREIADRELVRTREAADRGAAGERDLDAAMTRARAAGRVVAALLQDLETLEPERRRLESELAGAVADREAAELDVARATIRSPIDGFLQSVSAETGELVTPGQVVARVVDLSVLEVPVRVPVSALDAGGGAVRVGDGVVLTSDGLGAGRWTGTVQRIAPEASAGNRTGTVFVEVHQQVPSDAGEASVNGEPLLRPGQFVMARVTSGGSAQRLVVPRAAVDRDRIMLARTGVVSPNRNGNENSDDDAMRVVAHEVRVLYALEREIPALHPSVTQWVVLDPAFGGNPSAGEIVIISNLDALHPGRRVEATVLNGSGRGEPRAASGGGER